MSRRNPIRIHRESTQPKDICILLVNDDSVCQNIVADMLDHCRYEAFSFERDIDALDMIWDKKDMTELVLTNVHRTYAKKHGIIEHVEQKIKLQIILMSPDVDDINVSTAGGKGKCISLYYMKCLSVDEMNDLWATALAREKNKSESSSEKVVLEENTGSKRKSDNDDDEHDGNAEKKPRVVWTKEMHQKFLLAVAQLREDRVFPKKIVELMNVPGLTRSNVASHLQKYRNCMKRAQEVYTGPSYDFTNKFSFNTSQQSFQQSHWSPFQTGSRNTNTTTSHFNFDYYKSRSRTPQRLSLLKTIQLKPDHNFSIYGNATKNILLKSIQDSKVPTYTSYPGLRIAPDGKSVVYGQNSNLVSSVPQQFFFPDMRNDDSTLFPGNDDSTLFPGNDDFTLYKGNDDSTLCPGNDDSSLCLGNDDSNLFPRNDDSTLCPGNDDFSLYKGNDDSTLCPVNDDSTLCPGNDDSTLFSGNDDSTLCPPSFANFTPQQSSVELGNDYSTLLSPTLPPIFSPRQPPSGNDYSTLPTESVGLQWTDWTEPPLSGTIANASPDIFNDFTSTYLPTEFCELGAIGDDDFGVDANAVSIFDDLLFDNGELS